MQQIYRRTPMLKCSPANLLLILEHLFKNIFGWLLQIIIYSSRQKHLISQILNRLLVFSYAYIIIRSNLPAVLLERGFLLICSKFTEYQCRSVISINLRHGCSPVNLLHIFKTPFPKNTFGGLQLCVASERAWDTESNDSQSFENLENRSVSSIY